MMNEEAKQLQEQMASRAEKYRTADNRHPMSPDDEILAALFDLTAAVLEVARRLPPPLDDTQ